MPIIGGPVVARPARRVLSFPDAWRTVDCWWVYCRVSWPHQRVALSRQRVWMRRELERLGCRPACILTFIERGKLSAKRDGLQRFLRLAAEDADSGLRVGIVAQRLSRFLRSENFDSRRAPHVQPAKEEIEAFLNLAQPFDVATFWPPDMSAAEEQRRMTALGMEGKTIGRPPFIDRHPGTAWGILGALAAGVGMDRISELYHVSERQVRIFWKKWRHHADPCAVYARTPEYREYLEMQEELAKAWLRRG